MAAFVFLDLNGWELTAGERAFERTVMHVAAGACTKDDLTTWFRTHAAPAGLKILERCAPEETI